MKTIFTLSLIPLLFALAGCGSIAYSRPVKDVVTGAWAPFPEKTEIRSYFQKIDANAITAETKDGPSGFSRKVGVGSVSGQSEIEKMAIVLEAAGGAFGNAMRAYQGQAPAPTQSAAQPATRSLDPRFKHFTE